MAKRQIIRIDQGKCNGCGQCVSACKEGAIQLIAGKAQLISENYCDGLGACIGDCPEGAISIETREAPAFDEKAVEKHLAKKAAPLPCGCPGTSVQSFTASATAECRLSHWPVQLRLVPSGAPYLEGADLVVCADCVPFAVPDFHTRYLAGRAVVVGCPKLDDLDSYYEKFKEIFSRANLTRVTVLRMEVPCCGGLARAALAARDEVTPDLPMEIHTIGIRGKIETKTV